MRRFGRAEFRWWLETKRVTLRFSIFILTSSLWAGVLDKESLQSEFARSTGGFDGRAGICAQDQSGVVCTNGDQRFSIQSVMKMLVGMAVMDAVDHGRMRLDERVIVHKKDLSIYMQPIAKLVTDKGYSTTVGDLVRRGIVDSDSAAADILVEKVGGPKAVQGFLDRKSVTGVRFDRDEKHLQTEISGLEWRPEFVNPALLDAAIAAVPEAQKDAAYRKYQTDVRDTATAKGMAALLFSLVEGKLLSPASSAHLLQVMTETATGPDRLKAGVSGGWVLAHKTGTSGSWKGVAAATNDVGVLTASDGGKVSIVVFIGDSREPADKRAALMASAARSVIAHYR